MKKRLFFITLTTVTAMASCASSGEKKSNVAVNDTIINGKEITTASNIEEVVAAKNDTTDIAQVKAEAKAGKSQVKDINFHSKVLNANREYTIYLHRHTIVRKTATTLSCTCCTACSTTTAAGHAGHTCRKWPTN